MSNVDEKDALNWVADRSICLGIEEVSPVFDDTEKYIAFRTAMEELCARYPDHGASWRREETMHHLRRSMPGGFRTYLTGSGLPLEEVRAILALLR